MSNLAAIRSQLKAWWEKQFSPIKIIARHVARDGNVFEEMVEWDAHAIVTFKSYADGIVRGTEEMIQVSDPDFLRADATMSQGVEALLQLYERRSLKVKSITVVHAEAGMTYFVF